MYSYTVGTHLVMLQHSVRLEYMFMYLRIWNATETAMISKGGVMTRTSDVDRVGGPTDV